MTVYHNGIYYRSTLQAHFLPDFLAGFARKEFRGKLAIAITANFVNRNTTAEAKVEEISGVAFIFNQKFFLELKEETGTSENFNKQDAQQQRLQSVQSLNSTSTV